MCEGRLTMFIWQRALGPCCDLKCFVTANILRHYIFTITASSAKKRKGAVIRQPAFTFSSASCFTLHAFSFISTRNKGWCVQCFWQGSSSLWLWTAAGNRAQWLCNTGHAKRDENWPYDLKKTPINPQKKTPKNTKTKKKKKKEKKERILVEKERAVCFPCHSEWQWFVGRLEPGI